MNEITKYNYYIDDIFNSILNEYGYFVYLMSYNHFLEISSSSNSKEELENNYLIAQSIRAGLKN